MQNSLVLCLLVLRRESNATCSAYKMLSGPWKKRSTSILFLNARSTMTDHFDPYHRWLGISPDHRPPNHYHLLGIPLFESDADVIEAAADRQMTHVRSYQHGKHVPLSQ